MTLRISEFLRRLETEQLCRCQWTRFDQVCWLAALSEDVERAAREGASSPEMYCDELPRWLALLVPWMDDECSSDRWHELAQALARALEHKPRHYDWDAVELRLRIAIGEWLAQPHSGLTREAFDAWLKCARENRWSDANAGAVHPVLRELSDLSSHESILNICVHRLHTEKQRTEMCFLIVEAIDA